MQDKKNQGTMKKVGDKIERVGEKISRAGAEKIGNVVYKAGDSIEHSQDKKAQRPLQDKKLQNDVKSEQQLNQQE